MAMSREEYLERMRGSKQFEQFGLEPRWHPGEGDVYGFCHDEVVRQYHDTRVEQDGGVRLTWMLRGWHYAQERYHQTPSMDDVLALGKLIEPPMNSIHAFRSMGVYIGGEEGAPPRQVPELMASLISRAWQIDPLEGLEGGASAREYRASWDSFHELIRDLRTADDWYVAYESVHPFSDGNGRTGKILWNWLMGLLDEPDLVADYFGGGNP